MRDSTNSATSFCPGVASLLWSEVGILAALPSAAVCKAFMAAARTISIASDAAFMEQLLVYIWYGNFTAVAVVSSSD